MANVTTSQILENGRRRLVMKFTCLSDGTAETGALKVDASSSTIGVVIAGTTYVPGTNLVVTGIWYDLKSMGLRIQWDATAATDMLVLGGFGQWRMTDIRAGFGGLTCAGIAGATGKILFSTVNANLNASYTVILEMVKGVPQS